MRGGEERKEITRKMCCRRRTPSGASHGGRGRSAWEAGRRGGGLSRRAEALERPSRRQNTGMKEGTPQNELILVSGEVLRN
jgi:hypothetical protein